MLIIGHQLVELLFFWLPAIALLCLQFDYKFGKINWWNWWWCL